MLKRTWTPHNVTQCNLWLFLLLSHSELFWPNSCWQLTFTSSPAFDLNTYLCFMNAAFWGYWIHGTCGFRSVASTWYQNVLSTLQSWLFKEILQITLRGCTYKKHFPWRPPNMSWIFFFNSHKVHICVSLEKESPRSGVIYSNILSGHQ